MKKLAFLITLLLFVATAVQAQEPRPGEHFIEVTGTAELEIEPNEIYLTVRLKEFEEGRVKTTLETLDKAFLNALQEAAIERKNLELADAGLLLGGRRRDRDVFRQKTYQLKLSGAAEVEKFLSKIETVKVDYVDIVRVDHSDLTKLKLDVKVKALQIAKTKAQALVHGIGSELGKPIQIREINVEPYNVYAGNVQYSMLNAQYREEDKPAEYESSFKKIKLQAQVLVQFEIN